MLHLTATPAVGYGFVNWSGDGSGSTTPLTVTMTRNKTVTANFLVDAPEGFAKYYPADGAVGRSTATTLTWLASVRAERYEYCLDVVDNDLCDTSWVGTDLVRNAPQSGLAGNTIYYWQVRAVNPGGATEANGRDWWQFTTGPCYTLNTGVTPGGGGSVGVDVLPNCAGGRYSAGTVLHLTATSAGGYGFVNWSGDGSGSTNPLTVTMTRNKTVTANFLP